MRYVIALAAASVVFAQSFPSQIRYAPVASGLGALTEVTNAADGSGRLFVVEQAGRIRVLSSGSVAAAPFLDITDRVLAGGERGLLSVAFPPGYASKGYFYVNYTAKPDGHTVVARYRITSDPNVADPGSEEILFTVNQPYANHNGGMLAFSPHDGQLYVGMGDGGSGGDPQNNAQNDAPLLGKMLRVDTEGGSSTPQIWAKGLRNPWRFSFDRQTGDLWIGDVGQDRYEEIDFQPVASTGGENYGWRRMEGFHCYDAGCSRSGLTLPIFEYDHATGGCSVSGGYVYRGQRFSSFRGFYFFADYCSGNLWATRRTGTGFDTRLLGTFATTVTSFGENEAGELFLADGGGNVYQLTTTALNVPANGIVNAANYAAGLTPGSIASIFGSGITTATGIVQASSFPLPTELNGTTVTVGGTPAPIFATANVNGQEQINFQVPWSIPADGAVDVVVTLNGVSSGAVSTPVAVANPGIFAVVRAGAYALIYATGLGPVENPPATGAAAGAQAMIDTPAVTVGGTAARVTYAGLAPGFAGLYQVNVELPPGANAGDDVVITAGGTASNAGKL